MEVGQLNKVVVFKQNTPTTLGAGAKDAYTTLLTTRGSLRKLNGGRGLSFGELLESNSYEMITRYQVALANGLNMAVKVEIESKTYTIQSFEKIGEKKFYYKFILNQQNN